MLVYSIAPQVRCVASLHSIVYQLFNSIMDSEKAIKELIVCSQSLLYLLPFSASVPLNSTYLKHQDKKTDQYPSTFLKKFLKPFLVYTLHKIILIKALQWHGAHHFNYLML